MTQRQTDLLNAALHYLRQGWCVIPVNADKRPLLHSWEEFQERRPTEDEVREWWRLTPDANVAVVTGAVSGLVVVDVDSQEGLRALAPYLEAGTALSVTTGGGGQHFYLRHPGGTVPCSVRLLPGVDVRGDGGYVVAPPSWHRTGRGYVWDDTEKALSLPSPALTALIRAPGASRRLEPKDWSTDIKEGERDQELTRRVGRLIQAGVPAGEAYTLALAVNREHCKPPLGDAQVRKIVESIAGREAQKPKAALAAAPTFTVMTQRDMLRRYSDGEDRWTVAEWLPEASCGLLVAPPGSYKTWMLTALAYAVATGRPFLGKWEVRGRGPVLFIQQEDPWWMLQSRLGRMFSPGAPVDDITDLMNPRHELDCRYVREFDSMPVHWYTDRELHFSDKGIVARLEAKIAELRPKLVMIDPLYTAADSKDYMAEGAQKMAALKVMRDKYGCSFVIAHHTTVAGSSSEDRSSIWGSQFLNAWLEFGWRMPKGDEKGNIIVRHFKSAESPKRIRLKFKITDWSFGVDVDDAPATAVADRIEEVILAGGKLTERQIADKLGCSKTAVHKALQRMKDGSGHPIVTNGDQE